MRFCLIFLSNAFFERFLKDKGISFHNLQYRLKISECVANKSQTSLRFILTRLRLTQTKANALSMLINLRKHSHTQ